MIGMTSSRMALIAYRAMHAYGQDVRDAPVVTGDRRGHGEFLVVVPATGQRFRVTVTEMADRILCAHADDGQPMHWLEPGETCDRPGGAS